MHFFIKNPQFVHLFTIFSSTIYHSIVIFKLFCSCFVVVLLFCSCFVVVYDFIIVNRSRVFVLYE
jgi:hypothetical protein